MINPQESKKNLLRVISDSLTLRKYEGIFFVLNCIKFDDEEFANTISEAGDDVEVFSKQILRLLENKVGREEYIAYCDEFYDSAIANREFDIWEWIFYNQMRWLIEYFDENIKSVRDCYNELKKEKRRSRNDEEWIDVLSCFAAEKFIGANYSELIKKFSSDLNLYISEKFLNDVPGRFAWQAFSIEEVRRQEDGSDADNFKGDGFEYEHHIASLIQKSVPDARVEVTKASGDQGADIIFEIDRHKVVIQTKLYSGSVGNDAVQQVYAAKRYYMATVAVVVSNSKFTKSAADLAESLDVLLIHEDDVETMFSRAFS